MVRCVVPGLRRAFQKKQRMSLGERIGEAYSDPESGPRYSPPNAGRQIEKQSEKRGKKLAASYRLRRKVVNPDQERFLTVVASFALGYLAAVLFHDRINARSNTRSAPFQITKPPVDKHPRGFVQATVLKTISEHPQGMTSGEITKVLGSQGIRRAINSQRAGLPLSKRKRSARKVG